MAKEAVEAIRSRETKPLDSYEQWRSYDTLSSFDDANKKPNTQKKHSIDTIENLGNANLPAPEANLSTPSASQASQYSLSSIVDFGKKVWEWFCSPITIKRDNAGTTGKPAGDSVQPIGGSPVLTTPEIMIDKEMLEKLIKELQQQSHRITETLNESEEQIKEDERKIWQAFLQQMKIREEGIESVKFHLIFDQKKDRKIRKDNYNFEVETGQVEDKHRWWSSINTRLTVASGVVLVSMIGAAVLGFTGAGIPAGVLQVVVSFMKGGSLIMKANLDKDLNKLQGKSLSLRQIHVHVNFRIKDELGQMKNDLNKISQPVEHVKELEKNKHNAVKYILSK